ncbi:hypothetical protein P7H41_05325 [Vagococcus fluvialis]|uniref:hypothetical protein n=1 Tax=Vagococcus fluvialis TaxID=2738 RepID=UPI00288EDB44|nr:hypothetical protein [Vagococcus fluvialis]MDT2781379.1 hypothetical protein [Vagococcus fluvialis]
MAREYIESEDLLNTGRKKLNRSIDKSYDAEETSSQALKDANVLGNKAIADANKLGEEAKQISTEKGNESIAIAKENEKVAGEANLIAKDTNERMNQIISGTTDSAEVIDSRKPLGLEASETLGERLNLQFGDNNKFRPEDLSLIDKIKNQIESDFVDLSWYVDNFDSDQDNTDAVKQAIVDSAKLDVPIYVPKMFISCNVDNLNDAIFFGHGKILNKGYEVRISATKNKVSQRKFQNNDAIVRNTFGTFNNAVAHSVVVNGESHAEILGIEGSNEDYWLNLLATYTYRDSASQYLKNQSNLNFFDYDNVTYNKDYVQLNSKVNESIVENMIIDTFHEPKCSAIIKKVDSVNNRLYVHAWVRTKTNELRVIPANDKGIRVNPMSAAFGSNIVVSNDPNHPRTALAGMEIDVGKNQEDSPTVGLDMISMGKYKADVAFHARSNRGVNGWKVGYASEGSDKAFLAKGGKDGFVADKITGTAFLADGADKAFVSKGLNYKNELLSNEIDSQKFYILGDGTQNILRLGQKAVNENDLIDAKNSLNLLNSKTCSIINPSGHEGKVLFLANMLSVSSVISGKFVTGEAIKDSISLKSASTVGLMSNGNYWIVLNFGGSSLN